MDDLSCLINEPPATRLAGRAVVYVPAVPSTNDLVRQLLAAGTPDGVAVVTDEQTAGRGRFGRRWVAPAGTSLLLSVGLRPTIEELLQLPMAAGLATVESIQAVTGLAVSLKWYNDVMVGGRKVGGILVESDLEGSRIRATVIGIGLNVNFDPARVPGIPPTATSLMVEAGRSIDRVALARAVLEGLDRRIAQVQRGESLHHSWEARLETIGKWVRLQSADAEIAGYAEGTEPDGRLIVRQADGTRLRVVAGEVTSQTDHSYENPAR